MALGLEDGNLVEENRGKGGLMDDMQYKDRVVTSSPNTPERGAERAGADGRSEPTPVF